MRQFLVVTEMALSATLVVGATMLVRSVMQHATRRPGLRAERPVHASVRTRHADTSPAAAPRGDFLRTLATRIAAIPGVQSVSMASAPPGVVFVQHWPIGDRRPAGAADIGDRVRSRQQDSDRLLQTMRTRARHGTHVHGHDGSRKPGHRQRGLRAKAVARRVADWTSDPCRANGQGTMAHDRRRRRRRHGGTDDWRSRPRRCSTRRQRTPAPWRSWCERTGSGDLLQPVQALARSRSIRAYA